MNVRVGVQVPQRGVTWFHLCIMESFFLAETTKYLYLLFDPDNLLHNRGNVATKVETPGGVCYRPRGTALLLGPQREGDQEQDRVGDCGHLEPGQDKRVLGRFSARKMLEKKKRRGEGIGRPRVEDSR